MKKLSEILPDKKRTAAMAAAAVLFFAAPFAAAAVYKDDIFPFASFYFDDVYEMPWHFSAFTGLVYTFVPDEFLSPFHLTINGESLSDKIKEFFTPHDKYELLDKDSEGRYTL